jgi:hypothetical protein
MTAVRPAVFFGDPPPPETKPSGGDHCIGRCHGRGDERRCVRAWPVSVVATRGSRRMATARRRYIGRRRTTGLGTRHRSMFPAGEGSWPGGMGVGAVEDVLLTATDGAVRFLALSWVIGHLGVDSGGGTSLRGTAPEVRLLLSSCPRAVPAEPSTGANNAPRSGSCGDRHRQTARRVGQPTRGAVGGSVRTMECTDASPSSGAADLPVDLDLTGFSGSADRRCSGLPEGRCRGQVTVTVSFMPAA